MIINTKEVTEHTVCLTANDVNDDDWDYIIDALKVTFPDFHVTYGDGNNMSFTFKREKEVKTVFCGTECCPECNKEFDFTLDLTKGVLITCPDCGLRQHPCSLCDYHDQCSDGRCEEFLRKSLKGA